MMNAHQETATQENLENARNTIFGGTSEIMWIINENDYVKNCTANASKDVHSLSHMITRPMSQSDCIKMGHGVEKVTVDIIVKKNAALKNIKSKNVKGEKEKDHLFVDEATKTIYYAEMKSNLNLDTEKCKSTSQKCLENAAFLRQKYPDCTVKMFLVGACYLKKEDAGGILSKYSEIAENVVGMNEYFEALGVEVKFSDKKEYAAFLNYLANAMFK
jgi:hypothetical protein